MKLLPLWYEPNSFDLVVEAKAKLELVQQRSQFDFGLASFRLALAVAEILRLDLL